MAVLKGNKGPYRDIAIFNAAASLIVAGRAKDLKEGAAIARSRSIPARPRAGWNGSIKVSNAQ